jgi:transcriptional regulator with XRE-family HTH domain
MALIGKVLRDARLQAGLSLRAAAERAGMTAAQLSRVEAGKSASPEFITVARIAAVVDLSLDEVAVRSGAPGHRRRDKAKRTTGPVMSRAVADLARITKTASSLSQSANSVAEIASELSKRLERELPNLSRQRDSVR